MINTMIITLDDIPKEIIYEIAERNSPFWRNLKSSRGIVELARNALDPARIHEQISILQRLGYLSIGGKSILEVGAGAGLFVLISRYEYGGITIGIEPGREEFDGRIDIARKLLSQFGIASNSLVMGVGEAIPFPDETFDIVYSTNVLEHVGDPDKVLDESFRVLKIGGIYQNVIPNYAFPYEGHYGIPWIPNLSRKFAYHYVRIFGRNPNIINSLQFTNYSTVKRFLKRHEHSLKLLSLGEEIWRERLEGGIKEWFGMNRLQKPLRLIQRLRLGGFVQRISIAFKMWTPIILTVKKISRD